MEDPCQLQFLACDFRHGDNSTAQSDSALNKSHIQVIDACTTRKIKGVIVAFHINHIKGVALRQHIAIGQDNLKIDAAAVKHEVTGIGKCEGGGGTVGEATVHEQPQGRARIDGKCLQAINVHAVRASGATTGGSTAQSEPATAIDIQCIRASVKVRSAFGDDQRSATDGDGVISGAKKHPSCVSAAAHIDIGIQGQS